LFGSWSVIGFAKGGFAKGGFAKGRFAKGVFATDTFAAVLGLRAIVLEIEEKRQNTRVRG
jgi:hypothetical protein